MRTKPTAPVSPSVPSPKNPERSAQAPNSPPSPTIPAFRGTASLFARRMVWVVGFWWRGGRETRRRRIPGLRGLWVRSLRCFQTRASWSLTFGRTGEWGSLPLAGGVEAAFKGQLNAIKDPLERETERVRIARHLAVIANPVRSAEAFDIGGFRPRLHLLPCPLAHGASEIRRGNRIPSRYPRIDRGLGQIGLPNTDSGADHGGRFADKGKGRFDLHSLIGRRLTSGIALDKRIASSRCAWMDSAFEDRLGSICIARLRLPSE